MATPSTPDAPADSVLIARYRDGHDDAAAVLFARHHPSALRVARALVPEDRAEDLASEAFAKVLDALRRGRGPSEALRPYLATTVRNLHRDLLRRDGGDVSLAEPEQVGDVHVPRDPDALRIESAVLARAFASLPERWQVVLWHTCLQDESNETVGTLLGLDGPAVAALAYRARAGLRRAYVAEHVAPAHDPDCARARERLPAYVDRRTRSDRQLEDHLERCRDCGGVYLELRNLRAGVGAALAPALLGGAAWALRTAGSADDELLLVAGSPGTPLAVAAEAPPAIAAVRGATNGPGPGGGGPPGWLVPAASAAAVLVVVGMVLGIVAVTDDRAPAADREPTSPAPASVPASPSASVPVAGPTAEESAARKRRRAGRTPTDSPSQPPTGAPPAPGPTSATTRPSSPSPHPSQSPSASPSTGPTGGAPSPSPSRTPSRTPTASPTGGPTTPPPTSPAPTTATPDPTPTDPPRDPDPSVPGQPDPGDLG